jgi:hypothetical protein
MKKISLTHVIDCDADTFWKLFLDPEYNKKLYLEGLGFKAFDILEMTPEKRHLKAVPKMNVPAAVAKLLGDSFGYEDQGSLDKASGVFRWKMTPNTLQGKLSTSGTVKIESASDKKIRRLSEATVEASVFGLGGVLESAAEKEVREGLEKEIEFMRRWLTKAG